MFTTLQPDFPIQPYSNKLKEIVQFPTVSKRVVNGVGMCPIRDIITAVDMGISRIQHPTFQNYYSGNRLCPLKQKGKWYLRDGLYVGSKHNPNVIVDIVTIGVQLLLVSLNSLVCNSFKKVERLLEGQHYIAGE